MLGIHALNARDNWLVRWIFDEYARSEPEAFRREMQNEAAKIRELLLSRGVEYENLKSALTPTASGVQAAFLYDWWEHDGNYAVAFAHEFLPHLREELRTSVLIGDLHSIDGPMPTAALDQAVVSHRPGSINWNTQYAVYFSNLRPGDVTTLHEALGENPRYGGYIDASFTSGARDYLAATVVPHWVINGRKIIMSHGADEPIVGAEDPIGYDLPSHGYDVVSLIDSYHTLFMSYKIEATVAYQASDDRLLNLAAITGKLIDVETTDVFVHPDKLDKYLLLKDDKLRLMTRIGLQDVTVLELEAVIKTKLLQNYIYDFRFASDGTPLFAVSAEFEQPTGGLTRRLLALKHDTSSGAIALVTMY